MARTARAPLLIDAENAFEHRLAFADFLAKLPPKDRVNAERRVTVLAESPDPGLAELWQRLACALMTLAPHTAKLVGKQTVQYYIADGKYRMQVFALEDLQDGNLTVYCPNVLPESIEAGLLAPAEGADVYTVVSSTDLLRVESLNRDSINPSAHFKDMVGWNRTALRITLPAAATAGQVSAAELMCAVAARKFPRPAATAAGAVTKV